MHSLQVPNDRTTGSVPKTEPSNRFSRRGWTCISACRCLVVDDEPISMRLVAEMLGKLGFQVNTAEDGQKALSKISTHHYDLVVTDLEMPVMNGFLLASRTKKHNRSTKTVIMTARCHAEVFRMMTSAVVDAWLFKPFGLSELSRTIDDLKIANASRPAAASG